MKIIEATTNTAAVIAIRDRLHLLGVDRITAVQALDLRLTGAQPPRRLRYRGGSVELPASVFQLRVLVEDAMADRTVAALRWAAGLAGCSLAGMTISAVQELPPSEGVAPFGAEQQTVLASHQRSEATRS